MEDIPGASAVWDDEMRVASVPFRLSEEGNITQDILHLNGQTDVKRMDVVVFNSFMNRLLTSIVLHVLQPYNHICHN